jgi:hypothetical protein
VCSRKSWIFWLSGADQRKQSHLQNGKSGDAADSATIGRGLSVVVDKIPLIEAVSMPSWRPRACSYRNWHRLPPN